MSVADREPGPGEADGPHDARSGTEPGPSGRHANGPRSTIGAILNGTRACPPDVLRHYITACGVTRDEDRRQWMEAVLRVERYRGEGAASRFVTAS
ncbi:hypothetical protein [Streptomyces sp. CB01580]|uniref:hypothetical protein n=1 Tax=Streptomyces sp. CB01580 TaxID=1703933 RepID=UPI000938F0ED|nr:hypothetical protein [Streptomyces sp. CB01580]OKJ31493.1 hypothetical protein AMK22_25750 [Streptomyces sp. CB01580]